MAAQLLNETSAAIGWKPCDCVKERQAPGVVVPPCCGLDGSGVELVPHWTGPMSSNLDGSCVGRVMCWQRPRTIFCVLYQIMLARSQPMREDITYVTSSLIGWDLAKTLQSYIDATTRKNYPAAFWCGLFTTWNDLINATVKKKCIGHIWLMCLIIKNLPQLVSFLCHGFVQIISQSFSQQRVRAAEMCRHCDVTEVLLRWIFSSLCCHYSALHPLFDIMPIIENSQWSTV